MELIFFVVVQMAQCFEFVAEMVLITHQCFGCCWAVPAQCQGFPFLCSLGMQLGSSSQLARGTLHPIQQNAQQQLLLTPQTKEHTVEVLPSKDAVAWRLGGTTQPVGGDELLAWHRFLFLLPSLPPLVKPSSLTKPSLSPPGSFLTSFSCCGEREQMWVFSCCRGSFHNPREEQGREIIFNFFYYFDYQNDHV